jgi:hypothetical protein
MHAFEYLGKMQKPGLFALLTGICGFVLLATVVSCNQSTMLVKPPISVPPPNGGMDTIKLGDTLVLHPEIDNNANGYYNWTLNGVSVSADSVYTFIPTAMGDYQIGLKVSNAGGQTSLSYQVHVWGRYENGYFVLNEGIAGLDAGTLAFYRYDTQQLEDSVFTKENPGRDLGPVSSSLAFGTIYNNQIYLLSKAGGPLVLADPYSLKETGRIPADPANDFRSFLGLDNNHGLVSTADGILPLNLQSLALGLKITGVDGEIGDMIKAGNYIFVLSRSEGVLVLDAGSMAVLDTIPGMDAAFALSKDGAVWAAGDSLLLRIDPATLDTQTLALPFTVNSSWPSWHPGSILASTGENAIYVVDSTTNNGASDVFKYVFGDTASVQTPFISLSSGKQISGAGLAFNPKTKQLMVLTTQSGSSANVNTNDLFSYSISDASLQGQVSYPGSDYPEIVFFH